MASLGLPTGVRIRLRISRKVVTVEDSLVALSPSPSRHRHHLHRTASEDWEIYSVAMEAASEDYLVEGTPGWDNRGTETFLGAF